MTPSTEAPAMMPPPVTEAPAVLPPVEALSKGKNKHKNKNKKQKHGGAPAAEPASAGRG
jgi:hypothetical protein